MHAHPAIENSSLQNCTLVSEKLYPDYTDQCKRGYPYKLVSDLGNTLTVYIWLLSMLKEVLELVLRRVGLSGPTLLVTTSRSSRGEATNTTYGMRPE